MKHVDVVPLHDKFPLSQLIGSVIACFDFFLNLSEKFSFMVVQNNSAISKAGAKQHARGSAYKNI